MMMERAAQAKQSEHPLPSLDQLAASVRSLAERSDAAARSLAAASSGVFTDPDGRQDPLDDIRVGPAALSLVAYLSRHNPTDISIDVGFGMGTSVTMALAAQKDADRSFTHLSFDPGGLPGRGLVVHAYLEAQFPTEFRRVRKSSQVGLAQLLDDKGPGCAGYFFIDGGHTFEQVMVDFSLCDQLCCVDGHIVLDDAYFPAIEGVVEYIRTNRPDYTVWDDLVPNTCVVRKISGTHPEWNAYEPFTLPQRRGWTPRVAEWHGDLPAVA